MTSVRWIVLDNVKNNWNYWTNLNKGVADKEYLWLVNNEYIKDGNLTTMGEMSLIGAVITTSPSNDIDAQRVK